MRRTILLLISAGVSGGAMADVVNSASTPKAPGTYSNEEQVYFAKEEKIPAPPLVYLQVDDQLKTKLVDAFGKASTEHTQGVAIIAASTEGLNARLADNSVLVLRRARPATCWTAIAKKQPKPDGTPDWHFVRDVKLHDQGGRALIGGGTSGADPLVIRMRNVVWPPSADGKPATNKPSIVLYVHKPDQPDRAESYVWADPDAARIGINLRWMQASCGIDGADGTSQVTSSTFRG